MALHRHDMPREPLGAACLRPAVEHFREDWICGGVLRHAGRRDVITTHQTTGLNQKFKAAETEVGDPGDEFRSHAGREFHGPEGYHKRGVPITKNRLAGIGTP